MHFNHLYLRLNTIVGANEFSLNFYFTIIIKTKISPLIPNCGKIILNSWSERKEKVKKSKVKY